MIYYVLTNGNGYYIRKDEFSKKFVPVRNEKLAEKWTQRAKASNVLNNALPKNIRGNYRILEVQEEDVVPPKPQEQEVTKPKDEAARAIANESLGDDQLGKWSTGISSMAEFVMDAEQRKDELIQKLSEVDKEITDINHYIEFGKFNAYQGWLAFNMLRHRLKKRRKIKDELQVLQKLGECKITSSMLVDIKNAIGELSNRQYVPRVLTALFE